MFARQSQHRDIVSNLFTGMRLKCLLTLNINAIVTRKYFAIYTLNNIDELRKIHIINLYLVYDGDSGKTEFTLAKSQMLFDTQTK